MTRKKEGEPRRSGKGGEKGEGRTVRRCVLDCRSTKGGVGGGGGGGGGGEKGKKILDTNQISIFKRFKEERIRKVEGEKVKP